MNGFTCELVEIWHISWLKLMLAGKHPSEKWWMESARKFNMESKIAISKCRDHLANCPKPNLKKGGPCLLWGFYTSTCHSWPGKATDSGDAGTPSSKSSRFTVAPGIPKNLPGMEKEFQIGGLPSDPILHCITNRLGVHYQLYLTITI